ncbi:MAG: DUF4177 domain-containing protein [Eubacteriales bacterium]
MKEYKCIPAPVGLILDKKGSYNNAVNSYAQIINKETQGGWELIFIQSVPVTKRAGCLASLLLGSSDTTTYFNMLVFAKEKY